MESYLGDKKTNDAVRDFLAENSAPWESLTDQDGGVAVSPESTQEVSGTATHHGSNNNADLESQVNERMDKIIRNAYGEENPESTPETRRPEEANNPASSISPESTQEVSNTASHRESNSSHSEVESARRRSSEEVTLDSLKDIFHQHPTEGDLSYEDRIREYYDDDILPSRNPREHQSRYTKRLLNDSDAARIIEREKEIDKSVRKIADINSQVDEIMRSVHGEEEPGSTPKTSREVSDNADLESQVNERMDKIIRNAYGEENPESTPETRRPEEANNPASSISPESTQEVSNTASHRESNSSHSEVESAPGRTPEEVSEREKSKTWEDALNKFNEVARTDRMKKLKTQLEQLAPKLAEFKVKNGQHFASALEGQYEKLCEEYLNLAKEVFSIRNKYLQEGASEVPVEEYASIRCDLEKILADAIIEAKDRLDGEGSVNSDQQPGNRSVWRKFSDKVGGIVSFFKNAIVGRTENDSDRGTVGREIGRTVGDNVVDESESGRHFAEKDEDVSDEKEELAELLRLSEQARQEEERIAKEFADQASQYLTHLEGIDQKGLAIIFNNEDYHSYTGEPISDWWGTLPKETQQAIIRFENTQGDRAQGKALRAWLSLQRAPQL